MGGMGHGDVLDLKQETGSKAQHRLRADDDVGLARMQRAPGAVGRDFDDAHAQVVQRRRALPHGMDQQIRGKTGVHGHAYGRAPALVQRFGQ